LGTNVAGVTGKQEGHALKRGADWGDKVHFIVLAYDKDKAALKDYVLANKG
jgi:hypothetical protein